MENRTKEELAEKWMQCMRAGEMEKAWEVSDEILKLRAGEPCTHLPRHWQSIWNGSSLEGKSVLVRCYHGLGDTIQFIRYVPMVKAIAAEVIVWAQPELIPLLKSVNGIDQLIPLHNGSPDVEYDIDIEIMELSHIFRSTPSSIPSDIPYLHVEPLQLSHEDEKLSVGLVWRAGFWDQRRNVPFQFLAPLAEVENVPLYILQSGAASAGWKEGFGIHPGEFDMYDYARVINGLDLLISVDSMPAHLAGALGVPVWTLLHAESDWRWMTERDDTPWYPMMRLFRQSSPGDWKTVIGNVASQLQQLSRQVNKGSHIHTVKARRA